MYGKMLLLAYRSRISLVRIVFDTLQRGHLFLLTGYFVTSVLPRVLTEKWSRANEYDSVRETRSLAGRYKNTIFVSHKSDIWELTWICDAFISFGSTEKTDALISGMNDYRA